MANEQINPKIEGLAAQATKWMNFGAQVLNSGKATPKQFMLAKNYFGKFVMYAERPKPDTVSQVVFDNFVAAANKLGKALVEYQGAVDSGAINGGNGGNGGGYFSPPEGEYIEDDDELAPPPPPELIDLGPIPAGEAPGFLDFVSESIREHPLAWGAVAVVAAGVGYTLGKRREG
jgi:hypothetical protein